MPFGSAPGFLYELEDGLSRGAKPLMERDPVRFWQGVAFLLAIALFAALTQIN